MLEPAPGRGTRCTDESWLPSRPGRCLQSTARAQCRTRSDSELRVRLSGGFWLLFVSIFCPLNKTHRVLVFALVRMGQLALLLQASLRLPVLL